MDPWSGVFAAFGLSASAGLNAYLPLLVISLLGRFTELFTLKPPWDALTSWWVIGVLVILSVIEFFADKFPAVNHINDVVMTFVRPTAGAIAFAASANVITDVSPVLALIAGLFIAGGVHVAKTAVVRPAVTATTAGMGNVPVSIAEDVIAAVISVLSIVVPVVIASLLIVITSFIVFRMWRRANRRERV
jgi:hypothetical protein